MLRLIRTFTLLITLFVSGFATASSININTADATAIAESLDGIGLSKASAIVEYRKQHGNYSTMEDLLMVKGIGEKTLEKNQDRISFKAGAKGK